MTPSPHVALRPYSSADRRLLERLLGDAAAMAHLGGPESPQAIAARHERYLKDGPPDRLFAIVVGREATAVGWAGYWESCWQQRDVWECGWHVLREHQRKGIATAAVTILLERIRAEAAGRFVHAFPSVNNAASNALCRRLGFERCGEAEVEYPKGHLMRVNDWRFDLGSQ